MPHHHLAAIKLGSDPVGPLPPASFHRTLETWLYCPKCEAAYSLVAPYDWTMERHFEDESRRYIMLLQRAITRGHGAGHRITHFDTNGVAVTAHSKGEPIELPPLPRHIM
jgi:hypothetical protein